MSLKATEEEEVDEEADEEEEVVGEEVAEMEAEPSSGAKRQSLIVTMRTTVSSVLQNVVLRWR